MSTAPPSEPADLDGASPSAPRDVAREHGPGVPADAAWDALRRLTPARIGIGRTGVSVPTRAHLAFQAAHAQARDAVHRSLDREAVTRDIEGLGVQTLALRSAAADRQTYLQRPDLGRRLDDASRAMLPTRPSPTDASAPPELALVVADGLSARAVERHAAGVIGHLLRLLPAGGRAPWRLAPVAIVEQGRVAIGDDIGERLGASLVAVLIGERPGLSSPDSLGIYITWQPRVGRSDADRNCISNVRPEGLDLPEAASKLAYLLDAARQRRATGIALKDDSDDAADRPIDWRSSFLLKR